MYITAYYVWGGEICYKKLTHFKINMIIETYFVYNILI